MQMRLTERLKRDIRAYAQGSMYRMNARSADCYAFNITRNRNGRLDFEGGWDWFGALVDTGASYLYMLETDNFIKVK